MHPYFGYIWKIPHLLYLIIVALTLTNTFGKDLLSYMFVVN